MAPLLARDAGLPKLTKGSRDEASLESAHQEAEATAFPDRCRRLAVAKSERWER